MDPQITQTQTQQINMQQAPMQQQVYMQPQMPVQQMPEQQMYMQQQQMYMQPQMMYMQPKQPSKLAMGIKNTKDQIKNRLRMMGINVWCLLGFIGAILLSVGPFMNFATLHVNERLDEEMVEDLLGDYTDKTLKLKASDGLSLFELSKLSNTLFRTLKVSDDFEKEDLFDELEEIEDEESDYIKFLESETGLKLGSSVKEAYGIIHIIIKGKAALLLTPWLFIISGFGLLITTLLNKKNAKLVYATIAAACMIWLMICSRHFVSMMGIGALLMIVGIIFAYLSAFMDKNRY